MLRQTAEVCRSVLFRGGLVDPILDSAAGSIHVQYAACNVVKAFTANVRGIAVAQAEQQRRVAVASGVPGSEGIVIHDSAVAVSALQTLRSFCMHTQQLLTAARTLAGGMMKGYYPVPLGGTTRS
jgi:hypothetical protein